ncbi:hypothetical protein ACFSCZ_07630 [Siminovitchia sediminis]|uniref:Cbb3-type cytochrome oxidase assembly protein CcoS n=1 Tax=Siminovitchia sediminis TaxID=1274353 RepID=A0ABW4KG13_9BACI
MLNDFFIFAAPFLVMIAAIAATFWAAKKDDPFTDEDKS